MHVLLLLFGLLGAGGGPTEYARALAAKDLDQAALDAEGYGVKGSLKREGDGLRITLAPGEDETGWKTPAQVRFGGDFTITANFVIRTQPKPAQEDGAAVGLAIAFQDVNQPDATLLRLREPSNAVVYRSIEKATGNPMQPQFPMPFAPPGAKPAKPPRRTFPAAGDAFRMELQREGGNVRFQVLDSVTGQSRYLGQAALGTNDVAAVKLFATNRNGAEPVNVLLRDVTIGADRVSGLGTVVRTVFDTVVYGEPTSIEDGVLFVGGEPRTPPPAKPKTEDAKASKPGEAPPAKVKPATTDKPAEQPKPNETPPSSATPANAVAKAQAAAPAPLAKPKEPKAKIPLEEIESIRFERTPALAGRFLGQPNFDFTMPGLSAKKGDAKKDEPKKDDAKKDDAKKDEAKKREPKKDAADDVLAPPPGTTVTKVAKLEPKKNGIRDLDLALANLRNVAIKQVTVSCQTDKGPTAWRLDTTDSQDWPLVVRRSGTEGWADLFLEPPPGDCHEKDFTIAVTYADGQSANATVKAGEHTDPQRAVDPKGPAAPRPDAWIYLAGEERLFGKLEAMGEETLRLTTPWQDQLDVPLTRVAGIHFALLDRKETPESFARRLEARGTDDLLLAQTKNGEVLAVPGVVEHLEDESMHFRYQGKSRTLPLKQVEGLVLAARPESKAEDESRPTFAMPGGVVIAGRWKDLDTSVWKIETANGKTLNLPAPEVQGVRFRGGRMTYLSDLRPSKVEEVPYFGRRLGWRRNVNLLGEPLKMGGRTFERGLAVHSRCALTYDLDGRYATFEALVGFDDAAKGRGRVDCRVFADGKELYANPDLRGDGPPVKLALPVAGAEQLRLVVDYGRGQDTGDRLFWANARLHRLPSPKSPAAAAKPGSEGKPGAVNAVTRP